MRRTREGDLLLRRAIDAHGPDGLSEAKKNSITESASTGEQVLAVVLACDIRRSTFLMKEAVSALAFASTMTRFINAARSRVRMIDGWFDKFTGDGFLSYWLLDDLSQMGDVTHLVTTTMIGAIEHFNAHTLLEFRANSQNFPPGVGLAAGVDAGPCHLVLIGGDLTIVGKPVVGAERMVEVAEPSEILVNVFPGESLAKDLENNEFIAVHEEFRTTKDLEQEVYRLSWTGLPEEDRERIESARRRVREAATPE